MKRSRKILVTGGCGYIGTRLVYRLINQNYSVRVVDLQWFGIHFSPELIKSGKLEILKKGVNEVTLEDLIDIDIVIHLANIANDPSVELDPVLSWEVNTLDTCRLLSLCERAKIEKFIYASSGSVYGVSEEPHVTEDVELVPISAYNKTKMVAERICLSYQNKFAVYCVRPATVCGYSPRMRFDVVVNMFVLQAFDTGKITVMGGDQIRPNIHIEDMCGVYLHFVESEGIKSGTYNAGFENLKVVEIAGMVKKHFDCDLVVIESNDPRSYRQDSRKLLASGFVPQRSVNQAILDLKEKLDLGIVTDNPNWHTVKTMRNLGVGSK